LTVNPWVFLLFNLKTALFNACMNSAVFLIVLYNHNSKKIRLYYLSKKRKIITQMLEVKYLQN
jgi:hypothetical protein